MGKHLEYHVSRYLRGYIMDKWLIEVKPFTVEAEDRQEAEDLAIGILNDVAGDDDYTITKVK